MRGGWERWEGGGEVDVERGGGVDGEEKGWEEESESGEMEWEVHCWR